LPGSEEEKHGKLSLSGPVKVQGAETSQEGAVK
jgi:hypothetical protein